MPSKKLQRTEYTDPSVPSPTPIYRSGSAARVESGVDHADYHDPLEQVHGSGLHGWGVAQGLRVTATLGQPGVKIMPGIALDAAGHHISLAVDAQAEVEPDVDAGQPSNLQPVAAEPDGIPLSTAGLTGQHYVTIRWRETFNWDLYTTSYQQVFQTLHTPWLRLFPVGGFVDDGTHLVLARVTLGAGGTVTGLDETLRRGTALPAQTLQIRRGDTTAGSPDFAVENATAGEIRPRPDGGLLITVPDAGDQIHLERPGGSFDKLSLAAQKVAARRNDGKETVVIDSQYGNLIAGTNGVAGDIMVRDHHDRLVFSLDGHSAALVIGHSGNEGDVFVKDNAGQNALHINGATGDISFRGRLRDPGGSHSGIGHSLLRHLPDLTNGGTTSLHRHLNSGNATRASALWLRADNGSDVRTISYSSSRRVFAFIALTSMDPRHDFDHGDAFYGEVYRVDGNDYRSGGWRYGGAHLGSSGSDSNLRRCFFVGTARSITFRLRSTQDATVYAIAMVFPETAAGA